MVYSEVVKFKIGSQEVLDITGKVEEIVRKSGIEDGICNVFLKGSTGSLLLNENDPMLLQDLKGVLEKMANSEEIYQHIENAFSHIRSMLFGSNQSIPIKGGNMFLGMWQNIMVINFDTRSRDREILVTIVGD